jgi:hypothetical protein
MLEPPRGEERMRLVGDLIARFFTAYAAMAESRGEASCRSTMVSAS